MIQAKFWYAENGQVFSIQITSSLRTGLFDFEEVLCLPDAGVLFVISLLPLQESLWKDGLREVLSLRERKGKSLCLSSRNVECLHVEA